MRIAFRFTVILLSVVSRLFAQPAPEPVKGLATKEVYDLLLDHKGFVWVAHELGLSRINNGTFENFSNPQQASLSVTNLLEDSKGRIWCHNFSGQIFYVENGAMHLMASYDIKHERTFPQMVICNNELVVTSSSGLFICNINNLHAHYISYKFSSAALTLAVYKNHVVLFDGDRWFEYRTGGGITLLNNPHRSELESDGYALISNETQDTIFKIHNPGGVLEECVIADGTAKIVSTIRTNSFINSINTDNGKVWVHTKLKSFVVNDTSEKVAGKNITHILTDRQGNIWYSSLNTGLAVTNPTPSWKELNDPWTLGRNDVVRVMDNYNGLLVCGTQKGSVLFVNQRSNEVVKKIQTPSTSGGIEFLRHIGQALFFGTSVRMYCYQEPLNTSFELIRSLCKDIDTIGDKYLVATSNTLMIRSLHSERTFGKWLQIYNKSYPAFYIDQQTPELDMPGRCKSVRLEDDGTIAAAFFDGLVEIDHKSRRPLLFNGLPIYANALEVFDHKLYIATPGNGLLIRSAGGIKSFSMASGQLFSNSIVKIKRIGNHLWIFEDKYVQILDLQTQKILPQIVLPPIGGAEIYDIAEAGDHAYISSKDGIYLAKLSALIMIRPNCYIDKILVNGKRTLVQDEVALPYSENNLRFFLSTSWYSKEPSAAFKYRLSTKDLEWQTLSPGTNFVQLESLTPGDYTFEALAETGNGNRSPVTSFHFVILKPWWQQWWFWLLGGLSIAAAVYGLYRYRVRQVMRVDSMRRKLSSDLHDNIGATLSCVNIYAELAKEEGSEAYADMIQSLSNEAIQQLRDMVWTINPRNDSYEQLVNRMHAFAATFFKAAGIRYNFTYDEGLFLLPLDLQKRQNLYFIFKELVNNVVRHSEAANCNIEVRCDRNYVYLLVRDNGRGFSADNTGSSGNGINNILHRTEEMKGSVIIDSKPGTGTSVNIKVPV